MPENTKTTLAKAAEMVDASFVQLERAHLLMERIAAMEPESPPEVRQATSSLRLTGVTVREAARVLDTTEEHVRRLLRRRELFGVLYGGRTGWRIPRAYLFEFATAWHGGDNRRPRP